MNSKLGIVYVGLMAIGGAVPAGAADEQSDAAKVQRQVASSSNRRSTAAAAGGYAVKDVQVKSAAHQITVTVTDGNPAASAVPARDTSASRIASAIADTIVDKPEFSQVMVIHVNYVIRRGGNAKAVQNIDFFKSPAGTFVVHQT